MESPEAYIPIDRLRALARGQELPDRTEGAALFADISGFAPLTEALLAAHGAKLGADRLVDMLNTVYGALIAEVHGHDGTVISFSGDAITCWFEGDHGRRATTCAFAMQQVMARLTQGPVPAGVTEPLAIKIAVTAGPARRFVVGDPKLQCLDVLAGATCYRMANAERLAHRGEVIVGQEVIRQLGDDAHIVEWRTDDKTRQRCAVVSELEGRADMAFAATLSLPSLLLDQARPWLLPPVYERLKSGQGRFLAEILPAVALFLKFEQIDYDGDEAAGQKLDRFVRWVQGILAHYEGYLLQLTSGDKGSFLYAAFGAPLAHDDDPARSVAAALELRTPPAELDFITDVRIGISRGKMRTGAYGSLARCTYGVLGDEVNVAARLMEKAQAGQVLVTQRIANATRHLYHLQDMGIVDVKGHAPIPTCVVQGRRPPLPSGPYGLYKHPIVGRDQELAQVDQILGDALAGQGQVLCVEGAAGIGKSRLAAELLDHAIRQGFQVAQGTCDSTSHNIPYYPWRWIFRRLFDVADEPFKEEERAAWAARQAARVEAAVNNINADWLPRLPLLGDLLRLPIPDNATTAALNLEMRQQWLITLAVELILAWARARPLALIVEDAHWMDEASQKLTQSLGGAIAQAPAILVLVQRPQDEPWLPDLKHLSHHHHLDVCELAPHGIEALASDRLQGRLSALALAFIQALAQGNPLFAEESVSNLCESGGLVRDDGVWNLSEAIFDALRRTNCLERDISNREWTLAQGAPLSAADLDIPDTIDGVILARLGRLSDSQRLTLKVASVIGRTFELDLLTRSHAERPSADVLLEQLQELESRGLIQLTSSPHGVIGAFKHHFTQDVIYRVLLQEQQRGLHQQVGENMERLFPEEVERLAHYYGCSGDRDKTLFYRDKSARKARRAFANETALNYYNLALEMEQRGEWLKGKAEVLHILGRRDEERQTIRDLEAMPGAPIFQAAYLWGQYHEAVAAFSEAQAAFERALQDAQRRDDAADQARCLIQLALIARRQGQFGDAEVKYDQALDLVRNQETCLDEQMQALNGLGTLYREQGRFEKTQDCYEQALSLSCKGRHRAYEAHALDNLGTLVYHLLDFDHARGYHEQAIQIRKEIGDRAGEGTSLYNLALAQIGMGDYGQAIQYLSKAMDIQGAVQNRWEMANILMALGGLHIELGGLDQAKTKSEEGLRLCQELADRAGEMYIRGNLGLILREQGDLKAAQAQLTQCLFLAHSQRNQEAAAMCLSHLAVTSLRANQVARAICQAGRAQRIRDRLGLQVLTTANLATLALAHLATGDVPAAADYARQTMDILDGCQGEGPEFPLYDYFACYQVLAAAGEHERARNALRSAYRLLMERAAKITDPVQRNAYLQRVPIHREIVEEARRQGIAE